MRLFYIAALLASAALSAQNTTHATHHTKTSDHTGTVPETAKPVFLIDGKAVPSEYINFISPNSIESIHVLKGKDAAERFSTGAEGVVDIKLRKGSEILTYQQLVQKYQLDPSLQLVANKQLVKDRQNFIIDKAMITSVQTLSESHFAEPVIPHLPGEKMVYITVAK